MSLLTYRHYNRYLRASHPIAHGTGVAFIERRHYRTGPECSIMGAVQPAGQAVHIRGKKETQQHDKSDPKYVQRTSGKTKPALGFGGQARARNRLKVTSEVTGV